MSLILRATRKSSLLSLERLISASGASLLKVSSFATTPRPSAVRELRDDAQLKKLLIEKQALLLQFTAIWCGPCRMIAPEIEKLASEYSDRVAIYKVNIDDPNLANIAAEYTVTAVPTFIALKDGKQVGSLVGADKEDLQDIIKNLASNS